MGDIYYFPDVADGTQENDYGGVHINSSLLNMISWYLGQAGMTNEDQIYFWMNVSLAMTPRTDYPQMAELLPWVMETSGYSKYVSDLEKAIEKTRIGLGEDTEKAPEGCGKIRFKYEFNKLTNYDVMVAFVPLDGKEKLMTWPSASTNWVSTPLPEGEYAVAVIFVAKTNLLEQVMKELNSEESQELAVAIYSTQGWKYIENADLEKLGEGITDDQRVKVTAGSVVNLETETMGQLLGE